MQIVYTSFEIVDYFYYFSIFRINIMKSEVNNRAFYESEENITSADLKIVHLCAKGFRIMRNNNIFSAV